MTDHMRFFVGSILVTWSLMGCGVGDPFDGPGTDHPSDDHGGHIDVSSCSAVARVPEAARCVAPSGTRVALGLCAELAADNTLTLDDRPSQVDSTLLAVDGSSRVSSPLHVEGDFVADGGLDSTNTTDVSGSLWVGGDWAVSSPAHVDGDAFVAGGLQATNSVTIEGVLHVASSSSLDNVTAGDVQNGPVSVDSALDCQNAPDIAALVAQAKDRDDGDLGLHALEDITRPSDVTLGCGTYVVNRIEANNTLAFHVEGPTVLVVLGDFHVASPVTIDVDDGASLDLVIGGSLAIDNTLSIRALGDPSSTWVGVNDGVRIAAPFDLDGYLVAPRADVEANNTFDLEGAALVRGLHVASPIGVHAGPWLSPDGCVEQP